jgi:hypothetical protein
MILGITWLITLGGGGNRPWVLGALTLYGRTGKHCPRDLNTLYGRTGKHCPRDLNALTAEGENTVPGI